MTNLTRLHFLFLALSLFFCAPAFAAQGGYKKEKHKDLGLELLVPKTYETVALQPDEEWQVLAYISKPRKARKKEQEREFRERGLPTLEVVWIDYKPDPEVDPEAAPVSGGRTSTDGSGGKAKGPPKPITTLERYVDQVLGGWKLGAMEDGKDRGDYAGRYGELSYKSTGNNRGRKKTWKGFVYSFRNEARTIALIGRCHEDDLKDQMRIWKHMAERLEIKEQSNAKQEKWQRYYEKRPKLRDPEYRVKVRCDMVRGWEAEDLENYIVVYHTKDEPLVRQICRNVESIRKKYVELFPPAKVVTAVSTVRICRDQAEYLRYSGLPGTAGYWNWVSEELVLYDAVEKKKGKRPKDDNTFIILYHEAFHQYIYYSTGQLSPHSWYNEGYGDFFSGAYIKGGKVKKIGVNSWRIRTIQYAIENSTSVSWEDIIRFEQSQYYANPQLCYAQGWSMIYFLNNSPAVERNERWSQILPIYFDTIKAENAKGLEALDEDKRENRMAQFAVGKKAREAAVEAAFEDVDLDAIEAAWKKYIAAINFKE